MKPYDLLVKGGLVVSGSGIRKMDLAVKEGQIACLKPEISAEEAGQVKDVSGKYVIPGVIDVHVHPLYDDDMESLSRSAAYGGTTTILGFFYAKPGTPIAEPIEKAKGEGLQKSYLDFGIHVGILDPASQIKEISEAIKRGVSSFKMFMTYAKVGWMANDYHLAAAMDRIAECGGLVMLHAENGSANDYLEDRSIQRGEDQKRVFLKIRPDDLEAEAIFRAFSIGAVTHCPVYIVHASSAKSIRVIEQAKAEGQVVYAETCPQYLALTDKDLLQLGAFAKISPPLREEKDRLALWQAVEKGVLDLIASDHAPKAKKKEDSFLEAPYGSPQAETMLNITYDEGVNRGRIGMCKLVQLLSENPAKIFGLYPQKGVLQEGSDADIVVFDPNFVHIIQSQTQHSKTPFSLYEGRKCLGAPILSLQRGKILLENGEIKRRPGGAQFLPTKIFNKSRLGSVNK